LILKEQF